MSRTHHSLLAILLLMLLTMGAAGAGPHHGHSGGDERESRVREEPKPPEQFVRVTLKDGRFQPTTVRLKAGIPVRLLFYRTEGDGCVTALRFPSLGRPEIPFPSGTDVIVDLGRLPAGQHAFSCPMDMVRGVLQVKE